MADERYRRPTGSFQIPGVLPPGGTPRDPRMAVVVPFRYRYQSIIDFVEGQSINISRSGMFVASNEPQPVGTVLDFEFALADGFPLLRGKAEVVRVSQRPPGMGLRFHQLDEASRKLIERIVEVNVQEGKRPVVPLDFAEAQQAARSSGSLPALGLGVEFAGRDVRLEISPATVGFFTNNPLLNVRLGGFVVPGPDEISLGAVLGVTIADAQGMTLFEGKGKVVAKHEQRLGVRLTDAPKDVLARLQAEVARIAGK